MKKHIRASAGKRYWLTTLALLWASAAHLASADSFFEDNDWPMFGQNLHNSASSYSHRINTDDVSRLAPKWTFTTSGDVSARAAVVAGSVYFPDWGGNVYKLDARTGGLIWSKNIATDYSITGSPGAPAISRTSPAVDGKTLYIGTQGGGNLLAINTVDGTLRWKTQLDAHPLAVDTGSPVVFDGVVYVGVSTIEEGFAALPGYPCCSFRGSVVALDATTGKVIWKTYTVPQGYSGGSVWGSTIVPDPVRRAVYVTTGNNFSTPTAPAFVNCLKQGGTDSSCLSPDDHFDSVLALNMHDGAVKWSQRLSSLDDWNIACLIGGANCPQPAGSDFEFGSGANLITFWTAHGARTILGAGQKSGAYSAFDPDNGRLIWKTQVGPGSRLGGVQWGTASDGRRIYMAIANSDHIPYTLQPSGQTANAGSWSALDPRTGAILWQTADPNVAVDFGPLAVADGIVYAGSMAGTGNPANMFALDASTGSILWSFASGGSVIAGASIARGAVYWGSGYAHLPGFQGNNKFYAFSLAHH